MRYYFRHLFRIKCKHFIRSGDLIWSMRGPDIFEFDGTITEGTEIAVHKSIGCQRLRWHRGVHHE